MLITSEHQQNLTHALAIIILCFFVLDSRQSQ